MKNSKKCDVCLRTKLTTIYDAKTRLNGGCWAWCCQSCYERYGYGLGTGLGQRFEMNEDGKWKKTGG